MPRTKKQKPLIVAGGAACFWVNKGPVLRDLRELHQAFWNMRPEQFAHHVSHEKNDFAAWVRDVLGDAACARALTKARTLDAAITAVEKALAGYSW